MTEQSPPTTRPPVLDELAQLAQGARNALCDSMVERLTSTAGNVMEVADKLNDPDVRDGLVTLLDGVAAMHRNGSLDTLLQLVQVIHGVRRAATDSMIERAFGFVEHMASNLATEDLATLAHEAKAAMEDAIDHCNIPGGGGGMLGTLKMISNPETQEALRFMLAFSCSLRKRAVVLGKSPPAL